MKKVTFSCLTLATLLQLIPSNGNAANIQVNKKKTNRTEMKQDTIPANSTKKESEEGERNVMLNASDANKPREIQIGLPSEDVNVYENGLPAVYSSTVHKLGAVRILRSLSPATFCKPSLMEKVAVFFKKRRKTDW